MNPTMTVMIDFIIYVALEALAVKFLWTIADKWGILDWMQCNAPTDLIHEMLSCEFCRSFWLGLILSIGVAIFAGHWYYIFIPIFSSNLR